jgi:hypothetical protein
MTAPMKPLGFTLAARAVGLLASCAGGPNPSITIYLKRDLGPSGPPDQIAPVLAPAKRLVERGASLPDEVVARSRRLVRGREAQG